MLISFHDVLIKKILYLRIHWRLSAILKTSKKVYKVMFSNMYKYAYFESVFKTLQIMIKHKC